MISPSLYHAHHSLHNEDLPFWDRLARQTRQPVLELGCGTGRILLHLAQSQGQIYGLDRDAISLAYLKQQHMPDSNNQIVLVQADMINFALEQKFGLIILACNTLTTLSPEILPALYENVRRHLLPRGLFAASMPNPDVLASLPAESEVEFEEIFYLPENCDPVQVSSAWRREGNMITFSWYYDILSSAGRIQRQETEVSHFLQPRSAFIEGLRSAGFQEIETFGNFTGSPYRKSSRHLIFTAR